MSKTQSKSTTKLNSDAKGFYVPVVMFFSGFLMYLLAYIKVSGHVKLELKLARDYAAYILLVLEAVFMILSPLCERSKYADYIVSALIFLLILGIYHKEIRKVFSGILKRHLKEA